MNNGKSLELMSVSQRTIERDDLRKIDELTKLVRVLIEESKFLNNKEDMIRIHIDSLSNMSIIGEKIQSLIESTKMLLMSLDRDRGHSLLNEFCKSCKDIEDGNWINEIVTPKNFGLTPKRLEELKKSRSRF